MAERTGIKLPTETGVAERNQKNELQKLAGAKLDDAYLRDELQGHKDAIAAFENEIENDQNQEVKKYAVKILPMLQDHIRIAVDIAGKLGLSGKGGLSDQTKAIAVR